MKMQVPFNVDMDVVEESAKKFNVIFCPMCYFYLNGGGEQEIRLTFSNLSIYQIEQGVQQLAKFLKSKILINSNNRSAQLLHKNI